MATKKKRRSQEPWPGFDDGLDAAPSGEYVTPGGGRYERIVPPMLTGAAAARAKRLLGVCELEGSCQKVAGHDGPCTRRNPHEQYYGDEDPEDAERMRRLKAISDAAMGGRKNPARGPAGVIRVIAEPRYADDYGDVSGYIIDELEIPAARVALWLRARGAKPPMRFRRETLYSGPEVAWDDDVEPPWGPGAEAYREFYRLLGYTEAQEREVYKAMRNKPRASQRRS